MYKTCGKGEKTFYVDGVSLFPTGHALDEYAVRFRKHVIAIVEDIRQRRCIGLAKCEAAPNNSLKMQVLPVNDAGRSRERLRHALLADEYMYQ